MATYFFDDLNGSTLSGKSADVGFPTAQTWVNVDAMLDGAGNLVPDGSVTDGAFGSATYGPQTSTNVGVALVSSSGPYAGSNGIDLRVEFITPAVVQSTLADQYIFQCGLLQNGQYVFGRAMLLTGDAIGTVQIRVYTASTFTNATVTGVLPNTRYVAVIRTTSSGSHEMTVFNTTVTCTRPITGSNGVHRVSLGAGLSGKVASARLTEMSYSADARLTAPSVSLLAGSAVAANIATASLTAPAPTLSASASPTPIMYAPSPALYAFGGGLARLVAPPQTLLGAGRNTTGERAAILTAPRPTLSTFGGATAKSTAPLQTLVITGTFTVAGTADLAAPLPTLSANGKVSAVAGASLTAPIAKLVGYFGAVATVSVTGKATLTATGTTGAVGRSTLTAPLFELTAAATRQNSGSAILTAPVGRLATTGAAWLVAPGATLTAIGTAVVAVSYEAYALNLNHRNPDSPDELTRYTNYPFDRIVRYENSYFGMNATGLYLLEGTTDFAEPTPTKVQWGFKTGLTDFDSPNLKTVNWAYFGGRMAPAATISIHYGDSGEQNYAYSTPRGAEAQNYRQPFGRGIKSRYYAIEAEGSGALSIDSMMFDIASMARKV